MLGARTATRPKEKNRSLRDEPVVYVPAKCVGGAETYSESNQCSYLKAFTVEDFLAVALVCLIGVVARGLSFNQTVGPLGVFCRSPAPVKTQEIGRKGR